VFSRWLATTLVAAQLCAVAHLALVPHTASLDGIVASSGDNLQQHLDAASHPGPHAHTAAPVSHGGGEEHCTVVGLLRSAASAPTQAPAFVLSDRAARVERVPDSRHALTRLELLLVAPKASPPVA
jgi:hypothetical protein